MPDIIDFLRLKAQLQNFADARDWNGFHHPKNLCMALSVETAELVEIYQWMTESESNNACHDPVVREKTAEELADILLYLTRIADLMKINISEAVEKKLAINNQKYPADTVKGSAKKYNEYF
ncbi:hypothetical protein AQUSIP_06010 [Aquicella siphonis]|uniref:NTP pyrophosphohydrolase MazG putative catalytic core domain-containing protein n=1 Tax=Aquicella siphonis TaxID=254247 RepID=A0A5E4PFN0_9COXI|nr:nucleotide pyrophosphohydrolase [Aquicella siphonis]VVC75312.1 hypothetical protein AQUSIP_06010 [Aquicella siphonis]